MEKKLTKRQILFAIEYLKDFNGSKAAIRAGYAPSTSKEHASRLLTKPEICAYVQAKIEERAKKLELSAEQTLRDIVEVKNRCMQEIKPKVEKDPDGNWIETGEYIFNAKDSLRACELIGKHLGLFNDKLNIDHTTGGKPLQADEFDYSKLSTSEIKKLIEIKKKAGKG